MVGEAAFAECTSLTYISFADSVKLEMLEKETCMNCTALAFTILPPRVEVICLNAYKNCSSLQEIGIPATLERIHSGIFEGCKSLTTVRIPKTHKKMINDLFGAEKKHIKFDIKK